MRRYAGETFVIKYGGHAMGDAELAKLFASDIVLLRQVGMNPVVVTAAATANRRNVGAA